MAAALGAKPSSLDGRSRRWLQDIYDYIAADNEAAAHRTRSARGAGLLGPAPEPSYSGTWNFSTAFAE
jgi:hypothetical protein